MPERKRLVTLQTPELQGDDSWITIRKVSGYDGLRLLELRQTMVSAGNGSGEPDYVAAIRETSEILLKYLVDWNWVDDNGEPLPDPGEIDDLLKTLSWEEIMGISAAVRRPTEAQGNSDDGS